MSAIGGFLELETRRDSHETWHAAALALTSGRSCLRAILELNRPRHAFVPFYICDSALEPFRRLDIPTEFYGLTRSLEADRSDWPSEAVVVVVNYFDLTNQHVDVVSRTLGTRAIVDDTQAFFRRGRPGSFSFNSARKFFGVPDGAFAYGPGLDVVRPRDRNDVVPADHLTTRRSGDLELAYRQYQRAESQVSCEILSPSVRAQEVLAGVAYDEAFQARRRNFMQLHDCLGELNTLPVDFSLHPDAAPSCYPFLPSRTSLHEALWQREIFAPRLWPDIGARTHAGFEWERELAVRLLPLPIDHRYDSGDMRRVADTVCEVSR
jgi:hypothetical protein